MRRLSTLLKKYANKRAILFAAGFAVLGTAVLVRSFAAIQPDSKAVEGETFASQVSTSVQSDAAASGTSYLQFNASIAPTPTTAPTPTVAPGSCPNAQHTPGGSDGMGGCWPYEGNTGPAASVTLTAYTGPCTILSATTIDSKTSSCDFVVKAPLTIRNSVINGHFDGDYGFLLTIEDSVVNGGNVSSPAIGYSDLTIRRSEVTGGQHSILCGSTCIAEDNYLHSQYNAPGGSYHNNAYISNGGTNHTIHHNTLWCTPQNNSTGGGCTADASIFGDFAVMTNVTFDSNLFMATPSGAYCGSFGHNPSKPYGNNPTGIVVTNNVFQRGSNGKCGTGNVVTSFFIGAPGHVWTNNTWDDGGQVPPADD